MSTTRTPRASSLMNQLFAQAEEEHKRARQSGKTVPSSRKYSPPPAAPSPSMATPQTGMREKYAPQGYVDEKSQYQQAAYRPRQRYRWQEEEEPDFFEECGDKCIRLACRKRTWAVIILLVLALTVHLYPRGEKWRQDQMAKMGAKTRASGGQARARNGANFFPKSMRVSLEGVIQVKQLEGHSWEDTDAGRIIVVGDVHGCTNDLRNLITRLNLKPEDRMILAGDMIAKGPASPEVIDLAIEHNILCVRGNHEDRVILAHRDLNAPLRVFKSAAAQDGQLVPSQAPITPSGSSAATDLAKALNAAQIKYLKACPLIYELGELPGLAANATVVHGGLVPGLDSNRQDPVSVMNMRSIDMYTHIPSREPAPEPGVIPRTKPDMLKFAKAELKNPGGVSGYDYWLGKPRLEAINMVHWIHVWNAYQEEVPEDQRHLVIYGHDSAKGLIDTTWSIGLDTGCVKGNKLTAVVFERSGNGNVSRHLESVDCEKDWTQNAAQPAEVPSSDSPGIPHTAND